MLNTYEDIQAEWQRLAEGLGSACPPEGKATMMALMQHHAKLPITARCLHCSELMSVTDLGTAWAINCPCGSSQDVARGL